MFEDLLEGSFSPSLADDDIHLADLCRFLGIDVEDILRFDVSDLPDNQTTTTDEPVTDEPVLLQPDPKFMETCVVEEVIEDGGILHPSPSDIDKESADEAVVSGDGGCVPFVLQKIVQPRGAPNKKRVHELLKDGMELAKEDIEACRKYRKTAYNSYCDNDGRVNMDSLGNFEHGAFSHLVVYQALKKQGKRMKKIKNLTVLNMLMPCNTIMIYGSLNLQFECPKFPGFVNHDEHTMLKNDHAILVQNGKIKCINLIGEDNKWIALPTKKYLVIEGQDRMKKNSYLNHIRTAYVIE